MPFASPPYSTNFIGAELLYAGMPITDVFKENIGIGGVIGLLWWAPLVFGVFSKAFQV
jgi:hypothetical protein